MQHFFDQIPSSITILVVGKTGAGKSCLVNSLTGTQFAREGTDTTDVKKYTATIRCDDDTKDIYMTVWDSPGYEDDEEEEGNQDAYFKQLKSVEQDSNIDLLLFCTPLNERRWRSDDEKAMKAIHKVFGSSIWDKAMVALTQANNLRDSNGQVTKAAFDEKQTQWTHKINTILKSLGVQSEVVAVPTGNFVDKSLPNTDDWFSEFWTKALSSICSDKRVALWQLNESRIKFSIGEDRGGERSEEHAQ